jgi:DNA-binding PadR family transcriptional regulator
MSIQSAQENAVLDALVRNTRTVREVIAALDGHGMPASPQGVGAILAGLVRRGLVSKAGASYRITAAGQASVRRRKAGYPMAASTSRARELPRPAHGAVRMRGPSSVMATVCSTCAARLPSPERRVQPSLSIR